MQLKLKNYTCKCSYTCHTNITIRTSILYCHIKVLLQQNAKPHVTFCTTNAFIRESERCKERQRELHSFVRLVFKSNPGIRWYCFVAIVTIYVWLCVCMRERKREEWLHANPWSSWKLNRYAGRPQRKPGFNNSSRSPGGASTFPFPISLWRQQLAAQYATVCTRKRHRWIRWWLMNG